MPTPSVTSSAGSRLPCVCLPCHVSCLALTHVGGAGTRAWGGEGGGRGKDCVSVCLVKGLC